HARDLPVRARFYNDIAELLFVREPAQRANCILKCGRAFWNRRRTDDSRSDLHILLLERGHHILRRKIPCRRLVRVEPYAHRIFARTEDIDVTYAVEPCEFVANLEQRVIAGEKRIERSVRRDEVH